MGRVTRNGEQLVHGREIGAVAPLLERVGLSLAVVPRGAALPGGVDAWICDAETDEDLREIVRISRDRHPMLVGTAGLAAALAESLPHGSKQRLPHIAGPMLFVVGSASPISSAQIDALPPEVVRATPETVHLLTGSSDAVVFPLPAEGRELDAYVSRGLARDLVPILSRYDAVFLTGGATARAVLDTMKVRELRLLGEYEPGIPVCLTESGVPILTKAGAFGDERTLERIRLLRKP
jgi:4-hydroxythreonine-4-phosphate dehydrogenase